MTAHYLLRIEEYAWDPTTKSTKQRQVASATIGEDKLALAMAAFRGAGIKLRGHDDIMENTHDKHRNRRLVHA